MFNALVEWVHKEKKLDTAEVALQIGGSTCGIASVDTKKLVGFEFARQNLMGMCDEAMEEGKKERGGIFYPTVKEVNDEGEEIKVPISPQRTAERTIDFKHNNSLSEKQNEFFYKEKGRLDPMVSIQFKNHIPHCLELLGQVYDIKYLKDQVFEYFSQYQVNLQLS